MRRTLRAAAWTAVAITICTAGALAAPSVASQADTAPTVSYTEHGGTALSAANLGLNDLSDPADPAEGADLAAPVVSHAIAPALPETILSEDAPEARVARPLGQLVADYSGSDTPDQETECLARAVYWEAKGEPLAGQLTVAEVIINRSRSGRFAPTICGVVRQPSQFSFVRRGNIPQPPSASRDWRTAVAIAQIAMQELAEGAAPRALFFHARRVNPGWHLTRVATVGNHVFYR
jgi:N-acetylmuramoyl-L-alanine amidase